MNRSLDVKSQAMKRVTLFVRILTKMILGSCFVALISDTLGQGTAGKRIDGNPAAAAVRLVRAIESAYREVQACEIRQELQARDPDTGKEQPAGWRRHIVFDRRKASFRLDDWYGESSNPNVKTVSNGRQLWHCDSRGVSQRNRAMEVPAPSPLDFWSLVVQVPSLRGDWSPILALLMGGAIIEQLQCVFSEPDALRIQRLEPKSDDPLKLIGLRVSGWERVGIFGALVFWVDPQQFWIARTEIENESGVIVRVMKTVAHITDPKLEANAFDFDTTGLTVVNSYGQLGFNPNVMHDVSMIGKPAPAIRLKTLSGSDYDLAKDPAAVVVVAFAKWDRQQLQW